MCQELRLQVLSHLMLNTTLNSRIIIISVLKMRKLKQREVREPAPGHTARPQ